MRIFTFWEPQENIPSYLRLCMKTWTKFIPNAEIIIFDYNNIRRYINIDSYANELVSGKYSLPQIADVFRVMLLKRYGGLWMDVDTIILNGKFVNYLNNDYEASFFGYYKSRYVSIGFINSISYSNFLRFWADEIMRKLHNFKRENDFLAYFGNSIINDYIKKHKNEIEVIDMIKERIMPERINADAGLRTSQMYVDFYFRKKHHLVDMQTNLIMLHNSWTPEIFRQMSESDFLHYDCTLANILREVHEM